MMKNKQCHYDMKVPLKNFHLNGHALGFLSQTQKFDPPCTGFVQCNKQNHMEMIFKSFRLQLSGHNEVKIQTLEPLSTA